VRSGHAGQMCQSCVTFHYKRRPSAPASSSSSQQAAAPAVLMVLLLLLLPCGSLAAGPPPPPPHHDVHVDIDMDAKAQPFPHHFERCVGSGHGALTMREDWRQHVAMARRDLGIERVRFHGILDDDMSVSFSANETGFVNIDSTCDFLVSHNMSMVMELGG
jgi:hypothetical protein